MCKKKNQLLECAIDRLTQVAAAKGLELLHGSIRAVVDALHCRRSSAAWSSRDGSSGEDEGRDDGGETHFDCDRRLLLWK